MSEHTEPIGHSLTGTMVITLSLALLDGAYTVIHYCLPIGQFVKN